MQIREFRTGILPHLVNVALFLLITVVYFYPVLEGKKLKTNDNTVYLSASREIDHHREEYGEEPLWTNSMFGGMPAYLISALYPGNLIQHVDGILKVFNIPVAAIFLTMLGFYILLLFYGLNPWIAGAGAIAYSFSSYLFIILGAGHNTKAYAIAYMAPMIGSIIYSYRRNVIHGSLFLAWFLSLQIMANHLQITYYALLTVIIFGFTELIFALKAKTTAVFIRTTAILIIPVAIALSVNFASILTTWEYGKYSMRGRSELTPPPGEKDNGLEIGYATQWSYGVDETMTLIIPGFKGGASKAFSNDSKTYTALKQNNSLQFINNLPKYWGTQPGTDGPVYVGAIVFFLFVLALFMLKGPDKWWLLVATILSVMLSWGKNFMPLTELFMNVVPGYDKFRAVSMTLVIAEFCIPLLGFLGLHAIVSGKVAASEVVKGLRNATAVTGGLLLLFILFPGISGSFLSSFEEEGQLPAWLSEALIADRKDLLRNDAFRSLVFAMLAAGLIYYYVRDRFGIKVLVPALLLLILADMWPVSRRYLPIEKFVQTTQYNRSFETTLADKVILEDKGNHRVLNLSVSTFNDASTSYNHKSIGGYHGAKMKRYQELIDSVIVGELQKISTAKSLDELEAMLPELASINMLNTKYIIYNPDAPPIMNSFAKGNVWFADTVIIVEDSNAELNRLHEIRNAEVLVISKFREYIKESEMTETGKVDRIELTSYKANELVYQSSASSDRVAVFSEIHYPAGWRAFIDGNEVPHFRANYILRALSIPAGEHEIRFEFKPDSYFSGNKISLAGSLMLLLATAGMVAATILRKKRNV
jgi:hypothetical protein